MTTFRRSAAAIAGGAAVLTLAGTMAGVAGAETVGPASGQSDATAYQRSVTGDAVAGGTVEQGSTITIVNRFDRKIGWLVTRIKDVHPDCLVAVPATSTWTVSGQTYNNVPGSAGYKNEVTSGTGWVQVRPGAGWQADPVIWKQDYTVTCAPGSLNTGGLEWGTTFAFENKTRHADLGPTLTVVKKSNPGGGDGGTGDGGSGDGGGSTGGDGSPGAGGGGTGSLGSGSLGSLFG